MSDFFIDYTGKDYLSLVARADAFAQSILPEWTSRDDNDLNWATVKTVAYLISVGMFYIDLSVTEQDPYEVQIYKNALNLAKRFGMPVKKIKGATTRLSVTIGDHVSIYTINRGEVFQYQNSIYTCLEDVDFPVGVFTKNVDVQYGEFERYSLGLSDGTSFQKFIIDRNLVQDQSPRIFIDEGSGFAEWEKVDTLLMSREDDNNFRLVLNEDENYEIHFGDNKSGKVPLNNSAIEVEILKMQLDYLDKNYGNLPLGNIDTSPNSDIVNINQVLDATGGADKEDIKSIGRAIPQWISTAGRGVTENDFVYLTRRLGGVADASAFLDGNNISVYIIPEGGGTASPVLQDYVLEYLLLRTIKLYSLNILIPSQIDINIEIDITVANDAVRSVVKAKVEEEMDAFLDKPADVGRVIKLQDAYDLIKDIQGVYLSNIKYLYKDGDAPVKNNVLLNYDEVSSVGTITVNAVGGIV
jgi:hypothetical protein